MFTPNIVPKTDTKPLPSELNKSNPQPTQPLQEWPGKGLRVSSLLEWYAASTTRGTRTPQWFERFGKEYEYEDQTVHRYWRWVDKVSYERFQKWHQEWPLVGDVTQENILVSQARRVFQLEFNAVARLKNSLVHERGLGVGKGPRPVVPRKRKNDSCLSLLCCFPTSGVNYILFLGVVVTRLNSRYFPFVPFVHYIIDLSDPENENNSICSRSIHITASEDLGWRALPFDNHDQPQDLDTDLVFALLPLSGDWPQSDALDYQWACKPANVDVDQTGRICYWDGRTTHHAIINSPNPAIDNILLNACALDANHDTLKDHLWFAQMFIHAACLFDKF
ncbi:uncharacterized protein MELLADRAFT_67303 [Melampsora larici-populina 98AG31]|uniref:Uncharacterized protein n=1 Tax=Melampsora larici-populina (strain 98AG31 / pathotype 3-4-7) TaxID=747676 RepID=F4S2K3_MELLP|nr:uncharacterized protein MELLADRAFT_67303 [Melampsora larici-populina 98AG31]EGG01116.1 hypothetical protein MELLADRAFT_67303 [Melampsora larici-populina 98AG31]